LAACRSPSRSGGDAAGDLPWRRHAVQEFRRARIPRRLLLLSFALAGAPVGAASPPAADGASTAWPTSPAARTAPACWRTRISAGRYAPCCGRRGSLRRDLASRLVASATERAAERERFAVRQIAVC
jgi:hypothetical protein